nr:immunoglobulin light chain junction region [Macaca mulatta]
DYYCQVWDSSSEWVS